jgi:hypothetical protein
MTQYSDLALLISVEHAETLALLTEEAALVEDYVETEKLARELVEIMQILHGPHHLEVGIAQFYLALALEEQGKEAEAMEIRKHARRVLLGHTYWRN